jgi:hypothetical protein
MDDVALWPGNYPAGHYVPLFVMCGPLLACMLWCIWMAIRPTRSDRKERRMHLGPLGPVDPWTGKDPCPSKHRDAVPVDDVDGNRVAWLCVDPGCGEQLPAEWRLSFVDRYSDESLLMDR